MNVDDLVAAYAIWDERPGDPDRTVAYIDAIEEVADALGVTASTLTDRIQTYRRAHVGTPVAEVIAAVVAAIEKGEPDGEA